MRWIRFFILLILLTLLNICSLMDMIEYGRLDIKPDFLLILLVFISINSSANDTLIAAFAIGFAADISGATMGPATLIFGLAGGIISLIRQVVVMKRMIHQGLAVFIIGVTAGLFVQLLTLFKTGQAVVWTSIFGTSLYSAVAAPFVWIVLSILAGWIGIRHGSSRMRARI